MGFDNRNAPDITLQVAAAIGRHLRVKDNGSGKLTLAGAIDRMAFVTRRATFNADERVAVDLPNAQGVVKHVSAVAASAYEAAYAAASGKVSNVGVEHVGWYAEDASGDGSEVGIIMRTPSGAIAFDGGRVDNDAGPVALTAADLYAGKTFTNAGASGAVEYDLPAATPGMRARFQVCVAQELRVDPNLNETIALPSTGVQGAAGKYLTANAVGEFVDLVCRTAGQWEAEHFTGVFTAEA
jgi:hypothetical protein